MARTYTGFHTLQPLDDFAPRAVIRVSEAAPFRGGLDRLALNQNSWKFGWQPSIVDQHVQDASNRLFMLTQDALADPRLAWRFRLCDAADVLQTVDWQARGKVNFADATAEAVFTSVNGGDTRKAAFGAAHVASFGWVRAAPLAVQQDADGCEIVTMSFNRTGLAGSRAGYLRSLEMHPSLNTTPPAGGGVYPSGFIANDLDEFASYAPMDAEMGQIVAQNAAALHDSMPWPVGARAVDLRLTGKNGLMWTDTAYPKLVARIPYPFREGEEVAELEVHALAAATGAGGFLTVRAVQAAGDGSGTAVDRLLDEVTKTLTAPTPVDPADSSHWLRFSVGVEPAQGNLSGIAVLEVHLEADTAGDDVNLWSIVIQERPR
ncbi:MAG: hypothetical protein M5U09_13590 [Gammaproteobacteria bacterium]|nr:hypothetical protein [Gammaproteobacteria bacterium]